jgi:hypothetical protein
MRPEPVRAQQSYRHEAFLWSGERDFVDGLVPFIEEGIEAGEAVMVATTPEHGTWLARGLGSTASRVHFVEITELGRNPARIIPACQEFLERWSGYGRPARAIGEPVWEGRTPDEVAESQLHEALMNVAVDPDVPFWVRCPYDAGRLDAEALAEVSRSHPALSTADGYQGSRAYGGRHHAQALFAAELPAMGPPATEIDVTSGGADAAGRVVTLHAAAADLGSDRVVDLATTVRHLVRDALDRGAHRVLMRLWDLDDVVVCEVSDTTVIHDLLVGRHHRRDAENDAVGLANEVCDLVQVRSGGSGTTARLQLRKQR